MSDNRANVPSERVVRVVRVVAGFAPLVLLFAYLGYQKWIYQRDFDAVVWKAEIVQDGDPYVQRWRMIESLSDRYHGGTLITDIIRDLGPPEKCINYEELDTKSCCMAWDLGNGGYSSLHIYAENGRYAGMHTAENW